MFKADYRTNHRSFLNFCKIPWNSTTISKFHVKGQILRQGSKFCGPRKTVGQETAHLPGSAVFVGLFRSRSSSSSLSLCQSSSSFSSSNLVAGWLQSKKSAPLAWAEAAAGRLQSNPLGAGMLVSSCSNVPVRISLQSVVACYTLHHNFFVFVFWIFCTILDSSFMFLYSILTKAQLEHASNTCSANWSLACLLTYLLVKFAWQRMLIKA